MKAAAGMCPQQLSRIWNRERAIPPWRGSSRLPAEGGIAVFQSTTRAPVKGPVISAARMAEHEGLVCWVVRQQWLGRLSFLDALHAGRIGLWRALRGYAPTRGTCFSTYAVPVIARAVWQAVEAGQKTRVPRR